MNNNSFYGGRQGAPFIIVNRFRYISSDVIYLSNEEKETFVKPDAANKGITVDTWIKQYCMKEAFSQGGSYTDVGYDEYVIIDSFNKNDANNGKIFRRGYNITDDLGGALYIGQIVGPRGGAPQMKMDSYENVAQLGQDGGDNAEYATGELNVAADLIPGKDSSGKITDKILYNSCNVVTADGAKTTVYMGFKVPYLINEFAATSISAYKQPTISQDSSTTSHPFYDKWNLGIPKGIKGDCFKNFKVMTADNTIESYTGQADDISKKRQVLVYEQWNYDDSEAGSKKLYYVGDYNEISNVTLADDGTLTFTFTHNDATAFSKKIKWVNTVTLADNGTLTFTYNNGTSTTFDKKLKWITSIDTAANGTVTVGYNDGTSSAFSQKIKWLTDLAINTGSTEGTGSQKVKVIYNDGTSSEIGQPLNYIMKMALDDRYHLLALYSDPAKRNALNTNQKATYDGRSDWYDMGAVKSDSGLLIGLNLDTNKSQYSTLTDKEKAVNYLNNNYPSGLTGEYIEGKVVTIGDPLRSKSVYAFDYGTTDNTTSAGFNGWYYLGNISAEGGGGSSSDLLPADVIVVAHDNEEGQAQANKLHVGGVWFIIK